MRSWMEHRRECEGAPSLGGPSREQERRLSQNCGDVDVDEQVEMLVCVV